MLLINDTNWVVKRGSYLFQIGLVTFGILALELALIRWMSGQIRLFAYLNNLILIGCFLGMGLGMMMGIRKSGLVHLTLPALCLLCIPLTFSESLGWMQLRFPDPSIHLWGAEAADASFFQFAHALLVIFALFCGLVAVFLCAGSTLGYLLNRVSTLRAYSADILGSLLGILAIAIVTSWNTPPTVWLLLGCLPFIWLSRTISSIASMAGILILAHLSINGAIFSPYNRIDVAASEHGMEVSVNRDFHQYILDLSDSTISQPGHPDTRFRQMYDIPFVINNVRGNALVVGAGTGNDVQAALRNGYQKVYSVEIDPLIMKLGRELHPEKPYSDPKVISVVNDARAFFEQYQGPPFDVICYGLVDSHAMFSANSLLRLDNYLYTEEGVHAAWRHVAPNGHMTINFSVFGGTWIAQRLYWTIARATGVQPTVCDHRLYHGSTLILARNQNRLQLDRIQTFPMIESGAVPKTAVATISDDWPFLYLRPGIFPWGYVIILGFVLLFAITGTRLAYGRKGLADDFDPVLFLMGAAFMLMETRGITSLSLLFGSTWIVNSSVIGGILIMALLANLFVQHRRPQSMLPVFTFLLGTVLLVWATDLSALNRLPLIGRWFTGSLIHALPLGFAGVIVSMLLARSSNLAASLASNLLGSVLGGCLEYLSIYMGLRSLVMLSFVLYLGALFMVVRTRNDIRSITSRVC